MPRAFWEAIVSPLPTLSALLYLDRAEAELLNCLMWNHFSVVQDAVLFDSSTPYPAVLQTTSKFGITTHTMRRYSVASLLLMLAACKDGGGYYLEVKPQPAAVSASASSDGRNLILPLEVDQKVAETFVHIGFGLNKNQRFQSTEFLTPRLRTAQVVPLIRMVKQYNEFDGQRVAAAVEKLRGRVSGVEFGREGSPVLYIELPYWTHQREETAPTGMGGKISDADNDKFVAELKQVFVGELKADEFSVNRRRVRVWWD